MHPYFTVGNTEIPAYTLLILIGIAFGLFFVIYNAKMHSVPMLYIAGAGVYSLIGLMIGSKLLFALSVLPEMLKSSNLIAVYPGTAITYALSGYVFYGGLIGLLTGIMIFSAQFHIPFYKLTNVIIPAVPLAHFFGRIGCFLTGCCYGLEYDGICSVTYPEDSIISSISGTTRFPTQLTEACINLLIFFFLWYLTFRERKLHKRYNLLAIYLLIYPTARFFLEFLRGDANRGIYGIFSMAQWISIILIFISLSIFFKNRKFKNLFKKIS